MSEQLTIDPQPDQATKRRSRWIKRLVIAGIAGVVLGYGAIFLYAKVINDSPDRFDEGDLDAALAGATTAPIDDPVTLAPTPSPAPVSSEPTAAPGTPTTPAPVAVATPAPTAPAPGASTWAATDASQVGYRVEEVLFGVDTTAVGRSNQVTGSMTIEGTAVTSTEFSVDVATITSDESRRDNQFRGRIMSADEFPTATFSLTAPIELGFEPADGAEITTTATGNLTLRGVTLPVTFEVTAKQDNGLIGVQGGIPVTFADYSISNPSFGGISVGDTGLVEFVLVFAPG